MSHKTNAESEMRLKGEITPKTRIPLGIAAWLMWITFLGALAWGDLHYQMKDIARNSVTEAQQREWIDDFREGNPASKVPRLPEKRSANGQPIGMISIDQIQP